MTILGYDQITIRKEQSSWVVLTINGEILYNVGFQWAWQISQPTPGLALDFERAVYACLETFPLNKSDKEQIYERFPSLRGTSPLQVDGLVTVGIEYEEEQVDPIIPKAQKEIHKTKEKVIRNGRKLII